MPARVKILLPRPTGYMIFHTLPYIQKIAKEFLHKANPTEFFSLFLKATRLETVMQKIQEVDQLQSDIASVNRQQSINYQDWKKSKLEPAVEAYQQMVMKSAGDCLFCVAPGSLLLFPNNQVSCRRKCGSLKNRGVCCISSG